MGLQVRPRGTVSSVGIPIFLAIGAPAGVLEFSRLLQQYSFLGVDSTGVFEGVFEGVFDGVSEESFEGLFEGAVHLGAVQEICVNSRQRKIW